MPLRFDKAEFDEHRAGKSHTCESCCADNCKDCSGTCDCSKCHGGKDASVLDALESKVAYDGNREHSRGQWDAQNGICPACERGEIDPQSGICNHCYTPYQQPQQAEWSPEQVVPRQAGIHDEMGELLFGGGGTPCPHCEGTGVMAPITPERREMPAVAPREEEFPQQDMQALRQARWTPRQADYASMPPEASPLPTQTAQPYNPGAYESQVEGMHPAAQYTYQRAVQNGADPQAAMQQAQEKQGEMMQRTQQGQNTEGVQIPVIGNSKFVSDDTVKRVSHITAIV